MTAADPTAPTLLDAASATPARPYDVTEPIAEGITVLEASAGTGKTHTVASIVVAEVAEGRPLDELLVVTFTRKATGTLRERVWRRLGDVARALAPDAADTDDELVGHLRRASGADVAARRARLERAVSTFDTATIATTHGFSQQVLASLGVVGDAERGVEVVEDIEDLIDDAVDDLFVRRFHGGSAAPLFDRAAARAIAKAVVQNPDAEIAGVDGNDTDLLRQRFAVTLRSRIAEQKRRGRLLTYDDLLVRLQNSIDDEALGPLVIERLCRRFSMAIVDEFQDTDTIQWHILAEAFGAPPSRLVLVGDPKQAIYAFRGGDVHTYLTATAGARTRTLDVSWRSDQPLLDAIDGVLDGAQLGDAHIVHRPLRARPGAEQARFTDPAGGAPLSVRVLDRESVPVATTNQGFVQKDAARLLIANDLAAEVVRLLTGGSEIVERDRLGTAGPARAVVPGDIAVLVRRNKDAETVRDALRRLGVPAVAHTSDDVFATDAAGQWLTLLRVLEQPASTPRARSVALGPFFGWDATRLATATDLDWDHLDDRVHDWADVVRAHGATGLLARLDTVDRLSSRLLGQAGGERLLADLRHVAELLDQSQPVHPAAIAALVGWLTEERTRTRIRTERRRRLESDADAVAIHTIHGAKGLEFPIVLLPTLWDGPWTPDDELAVFHDPDRDGARSVGVGTRGQVRRDQSAIAQREREAEDLRLLYVALTRARHRVVLWWASAGDSRSSPLARVLLGREPHSGAIEARLGRSPDEATIRDCFLALPASAAGAIAVVEADGAPTGRYAPAGPEIGALARRRFERGFDEHWTRTSYSGLTQAAHDAVHGQARHDDLVVGDPPAGSGSGSGAGPGGPTASGPGSRVDTDDDVKGDEPELDASADGLATLAPDDPLAATVPLGDLPGGPRVGTMVHDLIEHTEFDAPDLVGAVRTAALAAGADRHVDGQVDGQVELLVAGLVAAIETPLGPIADGRRLRDIGRRDRLDELSFDLPLAGGDAPTGLLTMGSIAEVFATLPADDPLVDYHERLRDPLLTASVRGFLTGSIDLVARIGERHLVVDYKTNILAPIGDAPRAWHFRPDGLAEAMAAAHYPLQAALYAVGLHRYLRWRLADYDPGRHLGGVAYLFLRGMSGPDVPLVDGLPCGVFAWRPPAAFVLALSDVLDRGTP